jgi:hypothetical protein
MLREAPKPSADPVDQGSTKQLADRPALRFAF